MKTIAFADEGSSNSDTDKLWRMDAITMKMDAQYKEFQSCSNHSNPDCNDDDIPMSREEEVKFMQSFRHSDNKPYDIQKQLSDFIKAQQSTNAFVKETFMDLKTKLETTTKNHQALIQNLEAKFDRFADKQSGRPSGSLPSSTQPNPKEDFNALLDEGSKILDPRGNYHQEKVKKSSSIHDDSLFYGNSFDKSLNNLDKMLPMFARMKILSLTGKNVTSWLKKELCLTKVSKQAEVTKPKST
ncbi:hypothetical protein Tco_0764468 [Tanacetum coccineum]